MALGVSWISEVSNLVSTYPWLVTGALAVNLGVLGYWLWSSSAKEKAPNPFSRDTARPPEPFVADEKARNKVIKQGFQEKKLPNHGFDAIIVGSGIGGLAAGNILARAGKKVLILEQHDQAGGCCHTFVDKGFEFDVGIHYIGEMRNNTVTRLLVNQMTDGQLVWEDLDDELDIVSIGEPGKADRYPICTGKGAWRAAILKAFPGEEKAVDRLLELVKGVRMNMLGAILFKTMPKWLLSIIIKLGLVGYVTKYFKYSSRTLKETLDEITDNKQLKAVLSYSFGDYGTAPAEASFAMQAILLNHYLYGASYPRGGASEIAFHMIPPIEKAGGRVLVRAPVTDILVTGDGRVNGVRVQRGETSYDIHAPLVISDAGAPNTFMNLLPPAVASRSSIYQLLKQKKIQSGVGGMSLFVGLKGTTEELGLKAQNLWAFPGNDLDGLFNDYLNKPVEEVMASEIPLLFVSFPSTKDSTFKDRYPGKSVCTVVTLANWDWFKEWEDGKINKRGFEYDRIKNNIGDRMWEQVVQHFPQLKDKVEFMEVGSPASNKYYLASPKGEIYGLDHSLSRFADPKIMMTLRPETDIPGLLLTGQDVFSGGFMGAMMGGLLCASKALNRNVWQDLVDLKTSLAKNK